MQRRFSVLYHGRELGTHLEKCPFGTTCKRIGFCSEFLTCATYLLDYIQTHLDFTFFYSLFSLAPLRVQTEVKDVRAAFCDYKLSDWHQPGYPFHLYNR